MSLLHCPGIVPRGTLPEHLPGLRPLHRSILLEALVGLQRQFAPSLGSQPGD
jgi:hypothetical protein